MRYVLQRLLQFAIVFFIVTFGVMVLIRLGLNAPGDPARTLLGGSVTDEMIAEYTAKYRLDRNYIVQYLYWLGNFVTGEVCTVDGGGRLWGELWTAGRPPWFQT